MKEGATVEFEFKAPPGASITMAQEGEQGAAAAWAPGAKAGIAETNIARSSDAVTSCFFLFKFSRNSAPLGTVFKVCLESDQRFG